MTTKFINPIPYLRTSRSFPEESQELSVVLDKSYIDTAIAINFRTIGVFPVGKAAINGEAWFIKDNQRQQGIRQVYTFTAAGNIPHGLDFANLTQFSRGFGTFTDGTNWYGVIFGSSVAIAGQVSFYVDPTNIVVLSGAGAPAITSGTIVLEWLSNT